MAAPDRTETSEPDEHGDEPEPAAEDRAEPGTDTDEEPEPETATTDDEPEPETATTEEEPDAGPEPYPEEEPSPWREPMPVARWLVVSGLAAIGILLIIAIVAGSLALTAPDDGDDEAGAQPEAVTVHDEFGRSGETLGTTATDQQWEEVQGRWAATLLGAQVVAPDGDLPSLAVVDLEDTDGSVRFRAAKLVDGMGVVVRFRNASNYVAVIAARTYATWTVRHVVNGVGTDIGTIGLAETDDNTAVDVRMRGDSIDVYIDGVYQETFTIPPEEGATKVGMIAMPGVVAAKWAVFDAQNAAALTQGFVPPEPSPTTLG
jgi:hypothetical protein